MGIYLVYLIIKFLIVTPPDSVTPKPLANTPPRQLCLQLAEKKSKTMVERINKTLSSHMLSSCESKYYVKIL